MPIKPFDLLVIGELNIDLILSGGDIKPRFGQAEQLVDDVSLMLGGSTAILACGAAVLGLKVTFASEIGQDEFGSYLLRELKQRKVDTSYISISQKVKTGITVHLSLPDDRAMLTYAGTMATFSGAGVGRDLISQARHVHMSSYFLQPGVQPFVPEIFTLAHQCGATTSLDTGWDPSEVWASGMKDVLKVTDIFLPNEREAMAISGETSSEAAMEHLAETIPLVVVKQGSHGAIACQSGIKYSIPAFPIVPVETTGAGDNFNAGFLYAYINQLPIMECLRWGAACGAMATLLPGGLAGQCPAAQVRDWMDAHQPDRRGYRSTR
jgi:sugar/nucleoside kinase (ribokinase family)